MNIKTKQVYNLLKTYNFASAKQSKSVIVLFAGPSTAANASKIIEYAKKEGSIIIGSNYSYKALGIKSDYTYVANDFKLAENEKLIKNDIIVPGKIFSGEKTPEETAKHLSNHIKRGYHVFMAGGRKFPTTYTVRDYVVMRKDGFLPYSRFSSAGHGSMIMGAVCRPKKMLIVGLDGPTDASCKEKIMFDGRIQAYNKPQKNENFKNHFIHVVLPSMKRFRIKLETFKDVNMYGLNKPELGFKIL